MNIGKKDIMALKAKNKTMYCKAEIINSDYKTIAVLEGNITSGNYSINCDSDIRRTCNITMNLNNNSFKFSEDILFNHYIKIYMMKSMEIFKFHAFLLKNKNYHLVLISTYSYALKNYTFN